MTTVALQPRTTLPPVARTQSYADFALPFAMLMFTYYPLALSLSKGR
jgi:hypothetical protein